MADKTGIEWTDATWNPIRGCTRVSEGCRNCYAESVAARFSGPGLPFEGLAKLDAAGNRRWTGKIAVAESAMDQPLRWRRPRRIFVNLMSDLFHENVPDEVIDRVFGVMALAPQHIFQVLTKRPQRMAEWFAKDRKRTAPVECIAELYVTRPELAERWPFDVRRAIEVGTNGWPLPNVWLGVSVENQEAADERIPLLLRTPAAKRFLSCEPLLGPVDLERIGGLETLRAVMPDLVMYHERDVHPNTLSGIQIDTLSGANQATIFFQTPDHMGGFSIRFPRPFPRLDWVIAGGESGRGARPMHPDWARTLRDQCAAARVPFFFKQWGEYGPCELHPPGAAPMSVVTSGGQHLTAAACIIGRPDDDKAEIIGRFGKLRAGSLLDGLEHKAFPA